MHNLGWAIKGVNSLGNVVESKIKYIPEKALNKLQTATQNVLMKIIKANLLTIQKDKAFKKPSNATYRAVVTGSGALSGFFGSTTGIGTAIFVSELGVTTKFLMRTIMDIARSEGEDIYSLEGQLACLQVFALGGESKDDDGVETSYYSTRITLDAGLKTISASGIKMGLETVVKSVGVMGSSTLSNIVAKIASRLSLFMSEKFLAQAIPVLGAVSGGSLNFIFVNHFQKMASAHFTVRRLERKYGVPLVQEVFEKKIEIED
ncbi:EcsC family protein [Subsaximicrobium wynnwilliamsii]|uniref:EcsC family protein n=2 Tax=Subsaximicrobium wynnwilliamsii TaxID=291179 RepID=A0A5C6ZET0_9FLAO|nr:EcsC family protein [Subsaximicrobium wynnwilliamsii]TXD88465.1 EcsC family protein [Subsaximicrobium wynnwilliamsii]TXE02392.1 EcsC family protein [Subsaximicrobium wynnwilliamsii]